MLLTLIACCGLHAAGIAEATVADSVLTIPAGITALPDDAFQGRDDFHTVKFADKNTLTAIGARAFRGCSRLRSIKLPSSLTDIGSQAFAYCTRLRDIGIPKKVRHIGANAFAFCQSLTVVYLPPALRELESYAFAECSSLREATLPANANMLGEQIFSGCIRLESVTVDSRTPPPFECNSQLFDPQETLIYGTCTLRVPPGTERLYREAPGWRLFRHLRPL